MRKLVVTLTLALLAPGAWAQQAAPSPLLGHWSVDLTRLPIPEAMRPRSVMIRFADAGPQRLSTTVEVVDPRGTVLRADSTSTLDGRATPVSGNLEADTAAFTQPAPGVLVMQLARGGQPASTRIYTVSADGQSMTETVAYFNDAGQPALRANQFQRAPAAAVGR
ncbi:hypothetical protein KAK06_21820 [Ideonella sp. 4Y11]|uniref:LuxR family transcriptional regulator n=1 Tax=Ideonella aquatica TaxID=2824119 RepID=A0A940YJV5_9BURK|nr:hypothetical protein [Ideonella aquatica]MBQ0961593.1 hypothetical protein [Ideonella aquatica]